MINKRQRFEKVATNRVEKIIKTLDLLSNCSNPYNYEYKKSDIDKIFKAINSKLKITRTLFDKNTGKEKFKL